MIENIRIIGHRGARGAAIENTLAALKTAASLGIDAVEFDVRITKDKQPVVCHDENLKAVYGVNKNISDLTLDEIGTIKSASGDTIPTLKEVIETKIGKPLILDVKNPGSAELIHQALSHSDVKNSWAAGSLYSDELTRLKQLYPSLEITIQTYKHPFKTIKAAKKINASGVTLVLYLLNPLTYWLARRAGLKVIIYQNYLSFLLTLPWFVKLLRLLYPAIAVITDRPDKIVPAIKRP